jgi:hypothetical protein
MIKEKWGKNDTVPDTQIFKLDFTKSARYHKRKIKLERRGSGTAWQDGAPANAGSPTPLKVPPIVPDAQIFKLDFTKSTKYHKRKIQLVRKIHMSHLHPTRAVSFKKSATAVEESGLATAPAFALPAHDSTSADIGTPITSPSATVIDLDVHVEPSEAKEAKELRIVRARTATMPTGPTSLMEEGANYHELARSATKGRKLVGTVHSDGTVEVKRRWFCCGKRALGALEQKAIAAAMPKQEDTTSTALDKALAETIRERVRRSHRNVSKTCKLEKMGC